MRHRIAVPVLLMLFVPPAAHAADGQIAGYDTRILTLSVLKGLFGGSTDEPVTYVNAPQLAKDQGVDVRVTTSVLSSEFVNLVTLRGAGHSIAGTLGGSRVEPRLVLVDDHATDVPPAANMLVVRNDDRPGMIGVVGGLLIGGSGRRHARQCPSRGRRSPRQRDGR